MVIAHYLAEGKTYAEIAALTGSTEAAVKMQASRLRKHLREHWAKWLAGVTALGAFILFIVLARKPVVPGSDIGPDDVAMSATATTARPAASTAPDAEALRNLAIQMCQDGFYVPCEEKLDQAKAVDPSSESLPFVKEMRETIARWKARKNAPPGPLKP